LLLPARGFSRWYEHEARRVVVDGDTEARNAAVQWAIARTLPLLDVLAAKRERIADYTLGDIPLPTIDSSGELVDTTAEDPSAPPNQISGTAVADATVAELVKPVVPQQAADIEMETLHVGAEGKNLDRGGAMVLDPIAVPPAAAGPTDMVVLDPLAVPAPGSVPPTVAAPAAAPQSAPAAPVIGVLPGTQAFVWGDLRIVLFAASADAPAPAYDGLVIERVVPDQRPPSRRAEKDARVPTLRAKAKQARDADPAHH
jgi:hypothetical protein